MEALWQITEVNKPKNLFNPVTLTLVRGNEGVRGVPVPTNDNTLIYIKYFPAGGSQPYSSFKNDHNRLLGRYVKYNHGGPIYGGRSSRKKINKSSKRRKSSKRARTHRNRRQRN